MTGQTDRLEVAPKVWARDNMEPYFWWNVVRYGNRGGYPMCVGVVSHGCLCAMQVAPQEVSVVSSSVDARVSVYDIEVSGDKSLTVTSDYKG